jgi:hypothetical protein
MKGRVISAVESKELDDLRASLGPDASSGRIEKFAAGLFTVAATVGALGAGFNVAGPDLEENGQTVLAVAVVFAGLSLALALAAQIPLGIRYNPNSPANMRSQLERSLRLRLGVVLASGGLLVVALVLAAACPLISTAHEAYTGSTLVSYDLTAKGNLTVTADIAGARRFSAASLQLRRVPEGKNAVLVHARARTSTSGTAVLKTKLTKLGTSPRLRAVVATARWRDAAGKLHTRRARIPVRKGSP